VIPLRDKIAIAAAIIGAMTLFWYWDTYNQSHDASVLTRIEELQKSSDTATSSVLARLSADEERISALERLEAEHHTEEMTFQSDMRTATTALITGVAELRATLKPPHK